MTANHAPTLARLLAESPLDPHELVRLAIDGEAGEQQGEILFWLQPAPGAYHIGAELLAPGQEAPACGLRNLPTPWRTKR